MDTVSRVWPHLRYEDWQDTCQTLHLWMQLVGKVRTVKSPWINHSWHSTLFVTANGLTTSLIPDGDRMFSIDFDFVDHELIFQTTEGDRLTMALVEESVASFARRFQDALDALEIHAQFLGRPNEIPNPIPFSKDFQHARYDEDFVQRFWQVLVQSHRVMTEFRARFLGKSSPVHFFWGSFDLAVTRFSGRRAPRHPGGIPGLPDSIVREAYSQEVSSCGFWPGNEMTPFPAYYSYAYPAPNGFDQAPNLPNVAFYDSNLGEYILPYEEVRNSEDPQALLLSFFQSTYEAAADMGQWDRDLLEWSPDYEPTAAGAYVASRRSKHGPSLWTPEI